jgi:hypothetical protein
VDPSCLKWLIVKKVLRLVRGAITINKYGRNYLYNKSQSYGTELIQASITFCIMNITYKMQRLALALHLLAIRIVWV